MYSISLSSIPPRFDRLGPVLRSLLAQQPAPDRVLLCLPESYRRFEGPVVPPDVPKGVELLHTGHDLGPATKALVAARHLAGQTNRLIYCDDDWIMPPGWAQTLLGAQRPGEAVTGAGYGIHRLGRRGAAPGHTDIAMGFAGVLVDPEWLARPGMDPPEAARAVDDIWLSGQLARQGIAIRIAGAARKEMTLAFEDCHGLQDCAVDGRSRDQANRDCAATLHDRYGIWPVLDQRLSSTARAARAS